MRIIADGTHEAEMVKPERKRIPVYTADLAEQLAVIRNALQSRSAELTDISKAMSPPYPFISFDEMEGIYHVPSNLLLIHAALAQTARDLDTISEKQWIGFFDEYVSFAAGKGNNHKAEANADDVMFSVEMLALSDAIAEHIQSFAKDYSAKNGKSPISYVKMAGKTSHKTIAGLAVIYTASHLVSVESQRNPK